MESLAIDVSYEVIVGILSWFLFLIYKFVQANNLLRKDDPLERYFLQKINKMIYVGLTNHKHEMSFTKKQAMLNQLANYIEELMYDEQS